MDDYRSRKVRLPGGREIEIVYLGDVSPEAVESALSGTGNEELDELVAAAIEAVENHRPELWRCGAGRRGLVGPLGNEERGEGVYHLERICPECDHHESGTYGRVDLEEYRDALEEGAEELALTLREMERANMEDDVDRLIRAISSNLIQPIDF